MTDSPVTLRLDKQTRQRVAQIARQKRISASEAIRQAIDSWIKLHDTAPTPYESAAGLIGVVRGGNPKRSTATGLQFRKLLESRKERS